MKKKSYHPGRLMVPWPSRMQQSGYKHVWIKLHSDKGLIELVLNSREPAKFLHVVFAKPDEDGA